MPRMILKWFWRFWPHKHYGHMLATKYGCSIHCDRCGKSFTMMDSMPWGD